jgi:hypothetical protein
MAVTVSLYNHTARRFADGSNSPEDTYFIILCTASDFDAVNETISQVNHTELEEANGYLTGGLELTSVAVLTTTTNDAKFTANNLTWSATGGDIVASSAILFNGTDGSTPPLLHIDFGEEITVLDGTDFRIVWNTNGIISFTVE